MGCSPRYRRFDPWQCNTPPTNAIHKVTLPMSMLAVDFHKTFTDHIVRSRLHIWPSAAPILVFQDRSRYSIGKSGSRKPISRTFSQPKNLKLHRKNISRCSCALWRFLSTFQGFQKTWHLCNPVVDKKKQIIHRAACALLGHFNGELQLIRRISKASLRALHKEVRRTGGRETRTLCCFLRCVVFCVCFSRFGGDVFFLFFWVRFRSVFGWG